MRGEPFSAKYIILPGGCWEWQRARQRDGYGIVRYDGSTQLAHRVSFKIHRGDPGGLYVCHTCDHAACVNPEHLFLGDQAANMADMKRKGRSPINAGEYHPRAKFTREQVEQIRADHRLQKIIAAEYGTSKSYINKIKTGYRWK